MEVREAVEEAGAEAELVGQRAGAGAKTAALCAGKGGADRPNRTHGISAARGLCATQRQTATVHTAVTSAHKTPGCAVRPSTVTVKAPAASCPARRRGVSTRGEEKREDPPPRATRFPPARGKKRTTAATTP